jgi:hypothetical protein
VGAGAAMGLAPPPPPVGTRTPIRACRAFGAGQGVAGIALFPV